MKIKINFIFFISLLLIYLDLYAISSSALNSLPENDKDCFNTNYIYVSDQDYRLLTHLYSKDGLKNLNHTSELILVNANSPGYEEPIIQAYLHKYPNIKYVRLKHDPGLYKVYNEAIKMAAADLITVADIDDRRNPSFLEQQVKVLEQEPEIDLVYSDYFFTSYPNETWENHHYRYEVQVLDFLPERMNYCLPGPQPVWRKQMHDKYGKFDESFYFIGNWEFWCRAASQGSKFKKIEGISGLYYFNPNGLRTGSHPEKIKERNVETDRIVHLYRSFWSIPLNPQAYFYYSQLGQDRYVHEHFFKNKRNGVFVDIGAYDGITGSNSLFFEKELGWSGLCIEPLPEPFAKLKTIRNCQLVNTCVAAQEGLVEFIKVKGMSEQMEWSSKKLSSTTHATSAGCVRV